MTVVLLLEKKEVFVEISKISEDHTTFYGDVVKGEGSSAGGHLLGKEVQFTYDNILRISQKE